MNNFIFQNATKVYFGKGCVKEYLSCLTGAARTVMLAYGGGSIKRNGRSDESLAEAGIDALASFIREIGLPTTLRELGVTDQAQLKEIAASCAISAGSYRKMTHEEIYTIFMEGF